MQGVAFEQDVLCLAYFKSNFIGYTFTGKKEHQAALANKQTAVLTQFIGLDGKIIKTNSLPVSVETRLSDFQSYGDAFAGRKEGLGELVHGIQVKNMSQRGFACFYGETGHNFLLIFNPQGQLLWRKEIDNNFHDYYMLANRGDIYFLGKNEYYKQPTVTFSWGSGHAGESYETYKLFGYSTSDTTSLLSYDVVDDKDSHLSILSFENDPLTSRPYIAGLIRKPKHEEYIGMYSIVFNGVSARGVKPVFTYWDNNPLDSTTNTELFEREIKKTSLSYMFKGFDGLTYVAASNKINGAELIKQNGAGKLSIETNVLGERIGVYSPGPGFPKFGNYFYHLANAETKTDYLVADVPQLITIYDVTHKKIVHSIPHKEAGIRTDVLPAKEGYIMVSEYNKKEKYTKVSIEAL